MQDPSTYSGINPQFPEQEHLKCPRCDSNNTKFCYYNNYNLSQPRHFCKNCRRYWTKGGTLRNIPIGGGSRKNTKRSSNPKRSSPSSSPSAAAAAISTLTTQSQPIPLPEQRNQDRTMLDVGGSFSSLLASNGQLGNLLLDGLSPNGSSLQVGGYVENPNSDAGSDMIRNPSAEFQNNNNSGNFLSIGDSSFWSGANGWSDLSIYTPGSSF